MGQVLHGSAKTTHAVRAELQRSQSSSAELARRFFGRVCAERGVQHRLTKPYRPWTNGQAERMVRTIKEASEHR